MTKPLAESGSLPGFEYGSGAFERLPGFTYRQEGQCLVLTPARNTASHVLVTVIVVSLFLGVAGWFAYFGAGLIQDSWLAWNGIDVPEVTINDRPPSQAGIPALITFAVMGAGLFLFGFAFAVAAVWGTVADLCFGTRPSMLDRGRGEIRFGPRVVCGLGDIARLHVRRGHDPDSPGYLPNAFYYGSFVLRDGRQVPLASFHNSYSQKPPETALGNGVAGAQIEAVMQAVAAFLGLEYALTGGPDDRLRLYGKRH